MFLPFQSILLQSREDYYNNVTLLIFFSTEYAIFYLANHVDMIMKQKYTLHWVSVEEQGAHLLEVSHIKEMKADKWSFTAD